jgi:AraC family transcriptional regulator, transcriptional activator of pobA
MDKNSLPISTLNVDHRSPYAGAPVSVSWFRSAETVNRDVTRLSRSEARGHHARASFVTHSHAALAYCTEGNSVFEQNGRWQLSSGDVLLVPAGQPHRRVSSAGAAYWGLGVCVPCFAHDEELQRIEPFERVRDGGGAVVHIPEGRRSFLEHLFRELAAITKAPQQQHAPTIQRSLLLLILNEISLVDGGGTVSVRALSDVVVESLRYIERNCLHRLTLQDVAIAVGRSPAYVTTALSRNTGKSALGWIISGRMAEARRLLVHSSEPLNVIAERVGYADATHFIRLFRREHGKTPAAFRASARQSATTSAER